MRGSVPVAISAGGALGAVARYGLAEAMPAAPGGFPWATFVTNVSGCLLIGVALTLVAEVLPMRPAARRPARAFLGPGLLGGYTTFSTYAVEGERLVAAGATGTGVAYLVGTLAAALAAAAAGIALARRLARPGGRRAGR